MNGVGGVITGMLALAAFDAAVSTVPAASRIGGLADVVSTGFQRLISPNVPAIPVHGKSSHPYQAAARQETATVTPSPGATMSLQSFTIPRVPASPTPATTTTLSV